MKILARLAKWGLLAGLGLSLLGVIGLAASYLYLAPGLPSAESLKDVRLQVPMRVYSREGKLIAEFGEKRRTPLRLDDVPKPMIQAFLAAEDDRFFEHPGVDYQGILRAAVQLILTGEKRQGGSTITMQVARNFFLSAEKTFIRKLSEIFLALKIERELSKREILELYLNKIYLGNRAYGVAAAAQVYYGRAVEELSLAQTAMVAGLPKAPSRFNPLANLERALTRRDYVLGRMRDLGFITPQEYAEASAELDQAQLHAQATSVEAAYVAEMARAELVERYGEDAYVAGYQVHTTVEADAQRAALAALRENLIDYDERQGYRGPEARIEWSGETDETAWDQALAQHPPIGGLVAALVIGIDEHNATVYQGERVYANLGPTGTEWALAGKGFRHEAEATDASAVLAPGDIIRLRPDAEGTLRLAQLPEVEGALVSLAPGDGAITALVGGFDFDRSKFNRAVQAQRQPGSALKPFIYSAALANGYSAASIFNDAPIVVDDPALETTWRPENYTGRFYGPTRLREALVYSRNLVSIRLMQAIGVGPAVRHLSAFGLHQDRLPRDLSLALGSATVTPLELAAAYTVFANGGFRVEPYLVARIENLQGEVLYQADPAIACASCEESEPAQPAEDAVAEPIPPAGVAEGPAAPETADPLTPAPAPKPRLAPRVLDALNAYLMYTMMRDVIRRGTGRRAMQLGRTDLAGKTGTTNDQRDAWFCGFNGARVAVSWVGHDDVRPLGERETGSRAALPAWVKFMAVALRDTPAAPLEQPPNLVTARIDSQSGQLARADNPDAVFELFRTHELPQAAPDPVSVQQTQAPGPRRPPSGDVSEQLF